MCIAASKFRDGAPAKVITQHKTFVFMFAVATATWEIWITISS